MHSSPKKIITVWRYCKQWWIDSMLVRGKKLRDQWVFGKKLLPLCSNLSEKLHLIQKKNGHWTQFVWKRWNVSLPQSEVPEEMGGQKRWGGHEAVKFWFFSVQRTDGRNVKILRHIRILASISPRRTSWYLENGHFLQTWNGLSRNKNDISFVPRFRYLGNLVEFSGEVGLCMNARARLQKRIYSRFTLVLPLIGYNEPRRAKPRVFSFKHANLWLGVPCVLRTPYFFFR